jgi:hypothetical protein
MTGNHTWRVSIGRRAPRAFPLVPIVARAAAVRSWTPMESRMRLYLHDALTPRPAFLLLILLGALFHAGRARRGRPLRGLFLRAGERGRARSVGERRGRGRSGRHV